MPPIRSSHQSDQQPSAAVSSLQAQVAGLAGSLGTIAEVARANSSHFRKAGEGADRLSKSFADLNGELVRGFRDLVVSTHFAAESLGRSRPTGSSGWTGRRRATSVGCSRGSRCLTA